MSTTPTPVPGLQPMNPLLAQYYSIQSAIGMGAKVVRFQDRTVEYQSTDDMIKAANWLYMQLASQGLLPPGGLGGGYGGTNGINRQIRTYTNKGL